MKKRGIAALAVALTVLVVGCAATKVETGGWNTSVNGFYVNRGMEIEEAMVYTSEKENDTYSVEELRTFLEETATAYNNANGGGGEKPAVALKSCVIEGKRGIAVFSYSSGEHLVKFAEETGNGGFGLKAFSVQKVPDALAAGHISDGTFVGADGSGVGADVVSKETDAIAIVVEGAATVSTEGTITYVSEGVTLENGMAVTPQDGKNYIIFK